MIEIVGAGLIGMLIGCLIEKDNKHNKKNTKYSIVEKGGAFAECELLSAVHPLYRHEKFCNGLGGNLNIWGGVIGRYHRAEFSNEDDYCLYSEYENDGLRLLGLSKEAQQALMDRNVIYQYKNPPTALELLTKEFGSDIVNTMLKKIRYKQEVDLESAPHAGSLRLICCGAIGYWIHQFSSGSSFQLSDTFFHPAEKNMNTPTKDKSLLENFFNGRFRRAPLQFSDNRYMERQIPINGGLFAYYVSRSVFMHYPKIRKVLMKLSVMLNVPFRKTRYHVPVRREVLSLASSARPNNKHPGLHFSGATAQVDKNYKDRLIDNVYWVTPAVSSFSGVTPTTLFAVCQAYRVFNLIRAKGEFI